MFKDGSVKRDHDIVDVDSSASLAEPRMIVHRRGEVVLVEKIANGHLNRFEKFFVVNKVALVEENYHCRNADLVSKKNGSRVC